MTYLILWRQMTKLEEIRRLIEVHRDYFGVHSDAESIIDDIVSILDTKCGTHGIVLDDSNECGLCRVGKYE